MTDTKTCNLTIDEIACIIAAYGRKLSDNDFDNSDIERINYLNKRLKEFSKVAKPIVDTANVNTGWPA